MWKEKGVSYLLPEGFLDENLETANPYFTDKDPLFRRGK